MTEIFELANRLSGVSLATLLIAILWSSYKDYWCWSREREAMKMDRDEWRKTALQNLAGFQKAVDHASSLTGPSPEKRSA